MPQVLQLDWDVSQKQKQIKKKKTNLMNIHAWLFMVYMYSHILILAIYVNLYVNSLKMQSQSFYNLEFYFAAIHYNT